MTMKSINSKQDLEKSLSRVDELWNIELNTDEEEELNSLVAMIEAHEAALLT